MKQSLANPKALSDKLPGNIILEEGSYSAEDFQNYEIPFRLSGPDRNLYRIGKCLLPESRVMDHFALEDNLDPKALFPLSRASQWFYLHIEKGVRIEAPLLLEVLPSQKPLAFALFVFLEENAELTLIEHWSHQFESPVSLIHQQSTLSAHSILNHIIVNQSSKQSRHYEYRRIQTRQEANSSLFYANGTGSHLKSEIHQEATGKMASINSVLVSRSNTEQNADVTCHHQYDNIQTEGETVMKFVAEDCAKNRLNGMVEITPRGKGASGKLTQDVLNLSSGTKVKTIPGLKIDTNEVSAAHSSGVRNINDEELFYLKSRGLSADQARSLLITGFLKQELKKIEKWESAYKLVSGLL
jgi:Fe-S cluster assembly protein SufD